MYVKSAPYYRRDHRVYDYTISDDTWNISPIKFQDSFKALAIRNDEIVLIDNYKEQAGKEFIRIFPLSGDVDATKLPLEAGRKDAGLPTFLSATSDKNTFVIVYSSVMVLINQSEQTSTELALDLPTLDHFSDQKYYFRSLLYDNHLYLSPISLDSGYASEYRYYAQLPQHDEHTEHDKTPSPVDDDLLPPQHKKARLDQESAIEWKRMPQLRHGCSNLARFGKQLVTVHCGSWHKGIEIQAYSPITNSWVVVAETNEDFDHTLGECSSIVHLDDTGELMLIECGNNHRDVYKLSIEGT